MDELRSAPDGAWRRIETPEPAVRRGRVANRVVAVMMLGVGGGLLGAWACAPGAPARPNASAAAAFVPQAKAAPASPPAPSPVAPAPPSAREMQLEAELAAVRAALAAAEAEDAEPAPAAAVAGMDVVERVEVSSTAYCLRGSMRTGVRTREGVAAADPAVFPLGSVVRLSHPDGRAIGVFVIMDTGGNVDGREIDIWMDSCAEARRWGRRRIVAEVLELGRA